MKTKLDTNNEQLINSQLQLLDNLERLRTKVELLVEKLLMQETNEEPNSRIKRSRKIAK